jgi:hypothetical protein
MDVWAVGVGGERWAERGRRRRARRARDIVLWLYELYEEDGAT